MMKEQRVKIANEYDENNMCFDVKISTTVLQDAISIAQLLTFNQSFCITDRVKKYMIGILTQKTWRLFSEMDVL